MTEQPAPARRLTQGTYSLGLGALALILSILALILTYQIGVVAAIAALLSLWAGLRALLAAQSLSGQGLLAAIGLTLGLFGLAIGGVSFVTGLRAASVSPAGTDAATEAGMVATPSGNQVFRSAEITLVYPPQWRRYGFENNAICSQINVTCLLSIGIPGEDTRIELVRYRLSEPAAVEAIDQSFWRDFTASNPGVALDWAEVVPIDGLTAAKRMYHLPANDQGQTRYTLQIFVTREDAYFAFTANFPDVDRLASYQPAVEAIANSMFFRPPDA